MAQLPLASILIVEDDGELLQILEFVLADAGYKVSGAASGEEALQMVATERPDLIVLDVNMKGMSGLEVARRLRAQPAESRILIALFTGMEESAVRQEFADYDLFMPKLDDADALVKAISDVLAGIDPPLESGVEVQASAGMS